MISHTALEITLPWKLKWCDLRLSNCDSISVWLLTFYSTGDKVFKRMTNNKDNKRGFAERKTRYRACMNIQMEQSLKARWPSWFQRIDGLLQRLKKICHGPFAIKMAERAKTHQWKQTTCYIKRHVNFRPSHLTKTSSLTVETSWSAQLIAWM